MRRAVPVALTLLMTACGSGEPTPPQAPAVPAPTTPSAPPAPTATPPASPVVSLSVSDTHGCAAHADGTVSCWGSNRHGQLGDGTTTSPEPTRAVRVTGLSDAVEVGVGDAFTCARRRDATVSCWGKGAGGRLGRGASTESASTPALVEGVTGVVDLAVTVSGVAVARSDGPPMAWGSVSDGAFRSRPSPGTPTATRLPTSPRVGVIAWSVCAGDDAQLRCAPATHQWRGHEEPIGLTGGMPPDVEWATSHGCWIRDGEAQCVGYTRDPLDAWLFGPAARLGARSPWDVVEGGPARSVSTAAGATLIVRGDGTLGVFGALGYSEGADYRVVGASPGASRHYRLVSGHDSAACVVAEDESVWCWGRMTDYSESGTSPSVTLDVTAIGGQAVAIAFPG